MLNAFGKTFRIALSGESHSPLMSAEIQGVPEGIPLVPEDFVSDIDRRPPWPEGHNRPHGEGYSRDCEGGGGRCHYGHYPQDGIPQ